MLRIESLTYRIGPRVLLDSADAAINEGHRVGFVGRNGTGKTTLLKLISGAIEADEGRIEIPKRWRVGITAQEAPSGSQSLIDTVLGSDKELTELLAESETAIDPDRIAEIHVRLHASGAHAARARAARILAGLGFDETAQQQPCSDFSGGWRMRVALAALLFTEPDLLLLDEPTNHLDLEATVWLEDYLKRYPGTVLLVSHDRDLLNRVVDEILHLENGKLTLYSGGYDRFEATRRMRLDLNEKLRAKQDIQRAHIMKFVDRFRYKASKSRQAQSRLKMLARMEPILESQEEGVISFAFPEPEQLSPPLYTLDGVDIGYDGKPVLRKIGLRLDDDDRVALLGANGNGKSTLMKLLAGRLEPMAGDVVRSGKLKVGYFAQHQADEFDMTATPVLEMSRRRPGESEQRIRNHLGGFGFSQERANTKIANLSGGEKARLLFAIISADRPNILLLDEPTNHLDIVSREALIQALNDFNGAVVIVSHDPHMIELTADRFWLVEGGRVDLFDGDMEEYRARTLARDEDTAKKVVARGADPKEQRRQAAERRAALAPLRKRLTEAETAVGKLEATKAEIERAMADPALYAGDSKKLIDLQKQLGQIARDLGTAEHAWVAAQEAWDEAQIGQPSQP
ncbi:MAG TPA: ABC-F family ATP-binding cassette domain-containing protein [Alphaproteobacteria bacterium]|jgi:ATP-binding cassette subfamily F protein 3|nr:ABC-F family ATP-binding cassette domain-containing protein [Alphaproteobacteria bacterium]